MECLKYCKTWNTKLQIVQYLDISWHISRWNGKYWTTWKTWIRSRCCYTYIYIYILKSCKYPKHLEIYIEINLAIIQWEARAEKGITQYRVSHLKTIILQASAPVAYYVCSRYPSTFCCRYTPNSTYRPCVHIEINIEIDQGEARAEKGITVEYRVCRLQILILRAGPPVSYYNI